MIGMLGIDVIVVLGIDRCPVCMAYGCNALKGVITVAFATPLSGMMRITSLPQWQVTL